mmetsp:Transcript_6290/g.9136  ORF Transcript_6290/g.9136 Transcript_6290/m.9136 type:complete len:207 (-) Transcript_6290:218-838(-)
MVVILRVLYLFTISIILIADAISLNILIPGGTGPMGRLISSTLHASENHHTITILSRNKFLASSPTRVSTDFGWLGQSFLHQHSGITLRDWDGGDMLDIVGCDFLGWQEDTLEHADVVINLVGGFTEQRTMACERIVRESLRLNPTALQIMISPVDEDLGLKIKKDRVKKCEEMVMANCMNNHCLRIELNDINGACDEVMKIIDGI